MKLIYQTLLFTSLLFPLVTLAQEVGTLANVTANGGISIDTAGNLYVAHFGPLPPNPSIGKSIYQITPTGDVSLFVDGELNVGSGNGFDTQGFLYQSNFATNAIYKIDQSGQVLNSAFASVAGPVGITAGTNDTLYVCSCSTNSIKKVSPDGQVQDFVSSSSFNCPNGITRDDNGDFYITNFSDGRINKITPQGEVQVIGSTPVGNGHLAFRSTDQMLYIASYAGHQIFQMDLSGELALFAGTGSPGTADATDPSQATFDKPNGIELSPDECRLYISQDGDVLREIQFTNSECISSIQNADQHAPLNFYPNPTSGKLILEHPEDFDLAAVLIFDALGKWVKPLPTGSDTEFDLSQLPTGVYTFIVKEKNGGSYYKKIVVR